MKVLKVELINAAAERPLLPPPGSRKPLKILVNGDIRFPSLKETTVIGRKFAVGPNK